MNLNWIATQVGVGGNLRGVSVVELQSIEQAQRLVESAQKNRTYPRNLIYTLFL